MIEANNNKYEIIENKDECFNKDEFLEKCTEYFNDFDYIVGDYAYGKLRLKGFNDKNNKNFKPINDYGKLKNYIKDNCAYGCKYFVLKKKNENKENI